MEEEDISISEQSVTEAANMMQMIKDESAEKNVKVYVIAVICLGNNNLRPLSQCTVVTCSFSTDGGVRCLFDLQE